MKLGHRPLWKVLALPVSLSIYLVSLTTVPSGQQPPPEPREGTCEGAEVLFPDNNPGPGTLKEIPVPEPTNLAAYVRNRDAAIALGKALFWDMQVGSDGVQACASCHFRGGADPRSINQVNPGGAGQSRPDDRSRRPELPVAGRRTSRCTSWPIPPTATRRCCAASTTSSRRRACTCGSSCARNAARSGTRPRRARPGVQHPGHQHAPRGAAQHADGDQRRVHAPQFLGSARRATSSTASASRVRATKTPRVLRATGLNQIDPVIVRIDNASLASQAVGPPLSDREMGSLGRTFKDVGKRLASARPLRQQQVHNDDSVLGAVREHHRGLDGDLPGLVEAAFEPRWWRSNLIVRVAPERLDLVRAPPQPPAARQRVHDDRVQLRVVLRAVGAAL